MRTNMNRVSLWASGMGLVIGLVLPVVERGYAAEPTCTLHTLKGRYLFALTGTLFPPAFGVTEPIASNATGFHVFNGDGTGTDTVTVRVGSTITLDKVVAPITYTVNANCTGTYTVNVPDGPSFDIFIAPDGDEIATFATAPAGNQLASIDRRVSPN